MSSTYRIGLQEARGGYRIVLFSEANGKLVLSGEVIKNMQDAVATLKSVESAWNNKRDIVQGPQWSTGVTGGITVIPKGHKWPANAGPAKKKGVKLVFRVDNPVGYKDITIRRTSGPKKKATKKK